MILIVEQCSITLSIPPGTTIILFTTWSFSSHIFCVILSPLSQYFCSSSSIFSCASLTSLSVRPVLQMVANLNKNANMRNIKANLIIFSWVSRSFSLPKPSTWKTMLENHTLYFCHSLFHLIAHLFNRHCKQSIVKGIVQLFILKNFITIFQKDKLLWNTNHIKILVDCTSTSETHKSKPQA